MLQNGLFQFETICRQNDYESAKELRHAVKTVVKRGLLAYGFPGVAVMGEIETDRGHVPISDNPPQWGFGQPRNLMINQSVTAAFNPNRSLDFFLILRSCRSGSFPSCRRRGGPREGNAGNSLTGRNAKEEK